MLFRFSQYKNRGDFERLVINDILELNYSENFRKLLPTALKSKIEFIRFTDLL